MADRPSDTPPSTPGSSGSPGSRGSAPTGSGSGGDHRARTGPTGPGGSPHTQTTRQQAHQPARQAARPIHRGDEGPHGHAAHLGPLAEGPGDLGPAAIAALVNMLRDEPALGLALVDAEGMTIASNRRFLTLTVPKGAAEGATASQHDPQHLHHRATSTGRRGVWARVGPDAVRTARTSGNPTVLHFIHEGAQVQCDVWPLVHQDPSVAEGPTCLVVAVQGRFDPGPDSQCEPKRTTPARHAHPHTSPHASPHASGHEHPGEDRFTTLAPMLAELGELEALTARELEVLALIGQGMATREIASALGRSPRTVERHCDAIHKKLGTSNRVQMARYAMRAGLTPEAGKLKRV